MVALSGAAVAKKHRRFQVWVYPDKATRIVNELNLKGLAKLSDVLVGTIG